MGGAGLSTCRLTGAGSPTTHNCFPQAIKPKNNNNKKVIKETHINAMPTEKERRNKNKKDGES